MSDYSPTPSTHQEHAVTAALQTVPGVLLVVVLVVPVLLVALISSIGGI